MNIGIFLAYMPGVKLGSEGLGRYIGNLIKGFTEDRNKVGIACPQWLVESLFDLFEDFHIAKDQVEIITTQDTPIVWKIYTRIFGTTTEKKTNKKVYIFRSIFDFVDLIIGKILGITSMFVFLLLCLLGIAIGVLLLPLVLVVGILGSLAYLLLKLLKKNKRISKKIFQKTEIVHQTYSKSKESIQEYVYNELNRKTVRKLVQKANREEQDVWFVPTLFWPDAVDINATTVFVAPDLVTTEFPFPFAEVPGSVTATDICVRTVERADYFITYGDFIKREVLLKRYGKDDSHVISIAHINNTSLPYLQILDNGGFSGTSKEEVQNAFCRDLLTRLPAYSTEKAFLEDMNFGQVKYIFYASQQRPHKNILNLLRAYEYLLREKEIDFKLFLTCDLEFDTGLADFIQEHRLEHYVISFQRVPVQLLSALYACAELVVTPTLYEGAFLTFTIGEGMSVGTPCIMGRIPQVTDMIPEVYPLDHILFDPLDYLDMADRILYGVENRQQLYQDELPMYKDIEARTGEIVARDYVNAFRKFILLDQKEVAIRGNH